MVSINGDSMSATVQGADDLLQSAGLEEGLDIRFVVACEGLEKLHGIFGRTFFEECLPEFHSQFLIPHVAFLLKDRIEVAVKHFSPKIRVIGGGVVSLENVVEMVLAVSSVKIGIASMLAFSRSSSRSNEN